MARADFWQTLISVAGVLTIERVYQRVAQSDAQISGRRHDDKRIADTVRAFGGDVVMTSEDCANGTLP